MDRKIVHMDLDTFFVSCERVIHSDLNGIPLIIGGTSDRGVVASCSYEARMFGVRSAMPMKHALRLCPQAKVIKGDMELYSKYSHLVTEIIESYAPVTEKASIDEFYLDISGMDKFFGCYKWTNELSEKITKETGLPISFGLSGNKTVSKIATGEGKPHGKMEVPDLMIRPFLNPLSIIKIPMLGRVTFETLSRIGIRKIETLAEVDVNVMHKLLGKNGIEIWKKANGIDETPVEPYTERKSISSERTFEIDTMDIEMIKSCLIGMVEKLGFQLRNEEWLASTVTVKVRYNNMDTENKQCRIPYTSCDDVILRTTHEIFDKLYERRMRIRLVGVKLSGLIRGSYQINLFEDTSEKISLYQAIDKMKKRFGFDAIQNCGGAKLDNRKLKK